MTRDQQATDSIILRSIPYPYDAMLAICSDLDETPTADHYFETIRFLNSTQKTAMGEGVGLEVGNTIYFDMPEEQFSYWNGSDAARKRIHALIRSGHIDCLHSYGDLADTRAHAIRALEDLKKHDCRLAVWIDHSSAPTNFDEEIMFGQGDLSSSPAYHSDLTCEYGVQFVWKGRVTSVTGQNIPRRTGGIFTFKHPIVSAKTLAKEVLKGLLAKRGNMKYAMHHPNKVLREVRLRDNLEVYEFMRCNPYFGGVNRNETADGIAQVMTPTMLDRLVRRKGCSILYTHLGKTAHKDAPFNQETVKAFRLLKRYRDQHKILVTTTRRLLGFCRFLHLKPFSIQSNGGTTEINITHGHRDDLDGLSFMVKSPQNIKLSLNGKEIENYTIHPLGHDNQHILSLPWTPLAFPDM